MPRRNELQDELDRLRSERSALDRLMSKMVALDAALRVVVRYELTAEFAREVEALQKDEADA